MPKLDTALWRDMMTYLRSKHAPICRQWFEELRPLSLDHGLLKIATPTSIQQNYLQKKCLEQFTEAAQATTGALVAVRFVDSAEIPPYEADLLIADRPTASQTTAAVGASATATATLTQTTGIGRRSTLESPSGTPGTGFSSTSKIGTSGPSVHVAATMPPRPAVPLRPSIANSSPRSTTQDSSDLACEPLIISPDYSFETFVTGPGNQLAFAASVAVASQPGTAYNPLFIHGGVGLGKTHLLQAICQRLLQNNPNLKILYLSCDAFINQFFDCVQKGLMDQFRHRYRHVDLLVIDDIHFLANRERTQEEFFHTFNELHQSHKQIVLSSDAAPSEIPQLEERLVSRFQWGLVANITRPDYETRLAIVRAKTTLRSMSMPDDVISYIATRIDSNARELEGAITSIQAYAMLQNRPIDLALAQKALGEAAPGNGQITLQQIVELVTQFYNVKLSDLQSKRRHKSITMPRQVCMWLARKRTRYSLQEIGAFFGGRDHTTVMHSIDIVTQRSQADPALTAQLQQLDERLAKPSA